VARIAFVFVAAGILIASGIILLIYDNYRQITNIQLEYRRVCSNPASSCPFISYNYENAFFISGVGMVASGIALIVISPYWAIKGLP